MANGMTLKLLMNLKSDKKEMVDTKKELDQVIGSVANIGAYVGALKEVEGTLENLIGSSSDYIESLNLLGVAFKDNAKEAKNWAENLANAYGLDESTLVKTLGIFRQIGNSLNIDSEYADKFAKSITEMQLDLSSLYNLDFDRAGSVLMSAISGQYKALKTATGADITEATLSQDLLNLGIDRTIDELSRAERTMLIYNSIARQISESNGDLAKTINSPANQMKIFSEQVSRLARAIGNVLLPVLGKILPYFNAILMVLVELINMLAIFLGFDEDMLSGIGDGMSDISSSFDTGADSANKLAEASENAKKSLRGFDKLNVITTPTKSGSGSGGASAGLGSIDPKLLGILDQYNDKLKEINNKATKIRDRIMEWLGFSKDQNGEWEHTRWTFGDILAIAGGVLLIGRKIYKIGKLLNKLGLFDDLKSIYGVLKGIVGDTILGKLVGGFKNIGAIISGVASGTFTLSEGLSLLGEALLPIIQVVGGITAIILGIKRTIEGIVDILNGDTFEGVLEVIQGIAMVVGGVALLFGNWVVAAIAAVVAIVAFVVQHWEDIKGLFKDVGKWFDENVVQPIKDFISPIVQWIYDNVIKPVIDFFQPIIDSAVFAISSIYKEVKSIIVGIIKAISSIVEKIIEIVAKIIEIVVAIGKAIYDYAIKPVIDWFADIFNKFVEKVVNPIKGIIIKVASFVDKWIIKPIKEAINMVKDFVVQTFTTVGIIVADFIGGAIRKTINAVLSTVENAINGFILLLNGAIKLINKIPGVDIKRVSYLSIPRLATGGFVDEGQLFVAREKGAEMVGSMNNKTTVANNEQIVEGIRAGARDGFLDAMQYSSDKNVTVNIVAEGDTSGLLKFIKFKEKQNDRQYGL